MHLPRPLGWSAPSSAGDVIERLIQDEIVDETDVYVHIERRDHAAQLNQRQIIPVNAFRPGRPLSMRHKRFFCIFLWFFWFFFKF